MNTNTIFPVPDQQQAVDQPPLLAALARLASMQHPSIEKLLFKHGYTYEAGCIAELIRVAQPILAAGVTEPFLRAAFEALGVTFGDCTRVFGESAEQSPHVRYARMHLTREGEVEVDDPAVVSRGDDPGAYVMAWLWVNAEDVDCVGDTLSAI